MKWGLTEDTSQDLILEKDMEIFQHCNKYKYLGVIITKDGKHYCEIKKRITLGKAAISSLNGILWVEQLLKKINKEFSKQF